MKNINRIIYREFFSTVKKYIWKSSNSHVGWQLKSKLWIAYESKMDVHIDSQLRSTIDWQLRSQLKSNI